MAIWIRNTTKTYREKKYAKRTTEKQRLKQQRETRKSHDKHAQAHTRSNERNTVHRQSTSSVISINDVTVWRARAHEHGREFLVDVSEERVYCAVMVVHLKLSQNAQTTRYVKARIEHNHMTSTDDCCFFSHDCTGKFYTNSWYEWNGKYTIQKQQLIKWKFTREGGNMENMDK